MDQREWVYEIGDKVTALNSEKKHKYSARGITGTTVVIQCMIKSTKLA